MHKMLMLGLVLVIGWGSVATAAKPGAAGGGGQVTPMEQPTRPIGG